MKSPINEAGNKNHVQDRHTQHYDLTTPSGLIDSLQKFGLDSTKFLSDTTHTSVNLAGNTAKFALDAVLSTVDRLTQFVRIGEDIEQQKKAAIEIIKQGAENNVEELEITLSEKAGGTIGNETGYPIEVVLGKKGYMMIKVKYRKVD
jgi:hypothetical protein